MRKRNARCNVILKEILIIVLIISTASSLLPTVVLAESHILNASDISGSDFTNNICLANALDRVFRGDIDLCTSKNTENEFLLPLGSRLNVDTRYYVQSNTTKIWYEAKQCHIYANAVYNTLFEEWIGSGGSFSNSEVVIPKGSETASYDMLKNAKVQCGAYMRTSGNSDGSYNGNSGHTLIILAYDAANITYLEGNADGKGLVRITKETWDEFNEGELSGRGRRITHVIQPTSNKREEFYPSCTHKNSKNEWLYSNIGICSKCGYQFPYDTAFDASCAGTYKVISGSTAILRTGPYKYCSTVKELTSGTINVLGSVQNYYPNTWYKATYNGKTVYVYTDSLKPTHNHSYTYYNEANHPHNEYKLCSCGDKVYTGNTKKVTGCTTCYPVNEYSSTNPDDYEYPSRSLYYTSPTMKGKDVAWVQAVLYRLDYTITIDGSYGSNTVAVIKQFQTKYGLEVDGKCGPATRAKLKELWEILKHKHSFTIGYDTAHPHKEYKYCTCGVKEYTGNTKKVDGCTACYPATFTISFDANGGVGAPAAMKVTGGTEAYLWTDTPLRKGYLFNGWSEDPHATRGAYWYGGAYLVTKNTTLYAIWKKDTLQETVDADNEWYYYSYVVDAVNTSRGSAQVVLYNSSYGATTNTNEYGCEATVDATGKVTSNVYGVGNATIPSGGFVLSAHSTFDNVFVKDYITIGNYVYFDPSSKTVYVFPSQTRMQAFLNCRNGHCGVEITKHQVEPTYKTEGYTGDVCCSACNQILCYGESIPVLTIFGDINSDGKANNRDLALLQQYLSDWDVTIILTACDMNSDSKLNNRDLALLQQYLSDWDVTLE